MLAVAALATSIRDGAVLGDGGVRSPNVREQPAQYTYYEPTLCRYATNRLRSRSQAWRRHIVYKSTTLPYPAQLSKSTTLPYPQLSLAIRRIFYTQLTRLQMIRTLLMNMSLSSFIYGYSYS